MMRQSSLLLAACVLFLHCAFAPAAGERLGLLDPAALTAPAGEEADWLRANVPLFECPDAKVQEIYYFRWRVYHRHLKLTPDGWVVTEFLPAVPWAGKYNTISCAAGHHFYEGRWLRDRKPLDDYADFWFRKGGEPRRYSFWAADALYARYLATGDRAWVVGLLPDLVKNYRAWESQHQDPSGLYWQTDDRDGMEFSLGGSGYRPTINAYQFGDARAIAAIADLAGQADLAREYREKAARLKALVQAKLWDPSAQFFKTLPRGQGKSPEGQSLVAVREEVGFVPWYFNLPDAGYEAAWKQLTDPQGFAAPFGPTTAERRDNRFMAPRPHDCLWNGPSWPYATTQTLVALANLLNDYAQPAPPVVGKADYLALLGGYARSQYKDGKPWVAEDLDADTGKWIVDLPRSVDYNHSAYADPVVTGLVGLRPRADDTVEVNPLLPEGAWDYFCLEGVPYHGHALTIVYDKTGKKYQIGRGLRVLADGKEIGASDTLGKVTAQLPVANPTTVPTPFSTTSPSEPLAASRPAPPPTLTPWIKSPSNPVLGGALGTCFDVCVLKEAGVYRMYFSWRPKKSIALVESNDGVHWSDPQIVLAPNPATDWEADVNRPGVLRRPDGYHLWYTAQARGHSWIGHAISADGKTFKRTADKPVLSPEKAWEKVAVMCPDVVRDEPNRQYRMYYSGGEQYEPDAIGTATSPDGLNWTKADAPIFSADPKSPWEQHKVTACQVIERGGWFLMFYIGFRDVNHARIGVARSRDGVTRWERLAANPILQPDPGAWDADACYKPSAVFDGGKWMLWYNGRRGGVEQIGLATHEGEDLGFGDGEKPAATAPRGAGALYTATLDGGGTMTLELKPGSDPMLRFGAPGWSIDTLASVNIGGETTVAGAGRAGGPGVDDGGGRPVYPLIPVPAEKNPE